MKHQILLAATIASLAVGCKTSKQTGGNAKVSESSKTSPVEKKSDKKSYTDIITKMAKSDEGLFSVHEVQGKYYYEIPANLLGKDMLLITRIAQIPANLSPYLNAGSSVNEQVVRWEVQNDKILLKSISFDNVANDGLPLQRSVMQNNFAPILYGFDIEHPASDSTGYLIQIGKLFEEDIPSLSGLNPTLRKDYKVTKFDKSRSFIDSIKSFPTNIEIRHTTTFAAGAPPANKDAETLTLQMNQSMILLPEQKMISRLYDERVGWFTTRKIDYSSEALKSDTKTYLRRWRLEPKDKEAYMRGELVEPVKPIVYYLDPATPEKFRKYFKQGIEDWQVAFEAAGFKNAIIAKDPPSPQEDPDFSPEDARYSVVRYVASTTRNAVGPSVSDPRTGEIIESDIIWYHNHLRSYRNRYLIETGAANPDARTLDTSPEAIGEMMRRVICHEVGHALGLPHNMKASSAYPTDSLRSGTFTQKYGIATTIMDYARFNYVAQPGDENIRFVRQLGPYDSYAIEYGYRWYPNITAPEQEKGKLHAFVSKHSENPIYQFGSGSQGFDPNSQTESIGADAIKASTYGVKNLKVVAKNLISWTASENNNYADLEELYGELLGIYSRYIGHVATNVGGVYETLRTQDQDGPIYVPVPAKTQKEATKWMIDQALATPDWLIDPQIIQRISYKGVMDKVGSVHGRALAGLLDVDAMSRMLDNELMHASKDVYSLKAMLDDLSQGVFSKNSTDAIQRQLQRSYIGRIESILKDKKSVSSSNDIDALLKANLRQIKSQLILKGAPSIRAAHHQDLADRIDHILEGKES
ncbi:zinc-dependent metalloprotease [Dyadobacter tibetensis]|uniref:zinc-dependent metalloprotease n=1 Tax=Dyadobacter tibetensis TaxID=1211851 RepID=UPI000470095C|nr:zinc-dependent metalloprotease [Dyadobacter tibetensis]